jgi:hypothetical protein
MGMLDKFRRWLDADYQEETGKEARPRNKAEEFLVNIAREVEKVMRAEMFTPPGGPTYIPRNYIIFLSVDDDADWKGEKRRGLEQGLFHVLSEQAMTLIGEKQNLQTGSFAVEVRVDGSLEKGKFRVQAIWDDEADKTRVLPRKEPAIKAAQPPAMDESEDDATIVRARTLFIATVKYPNDGEIKTFKFNQARITIGRGSRDTKVDLPLQGDMEISRQQALIEFQQDKFKITCAGRNSIFIDNNEVLPGAWALVNAGQRIEICSFILQLSLPGK